MGTRGSNGAFGRAAGLRRGAAEALFSRLGADFAPSAEGVLMTGWGRIEGEERGKERLIRLPRRAGPSRRGRNGDGENAAYGVRLRAKEKMTPITGEPVQRASNWGADLEVSRR